MKQGKKAPKGAGFNGVGAAITVLGLLLLAYHTFQIADDVWLVINDPNQENKPGEVLKLAVDITRYFPE